MTELEEWADDDANDANRGKGGDREIGLRDARRSSGSGKPPAAVTLSEAAFKSFMLDYINASEDQPNSMLPGR